MLTLHGCPPAGGRFALLLSTAAGIMLMCGAPRPLAADTLKTETPAVFVARVDSFDYVKREVMIPMRDGVKLKTVILVPRDARW